MEDRITLLEGDAAEVLKGLEGPYDLIFMDAAKGQYIHFLPEVMRLLAVGGMLISDNCLQDGDLIESRFAVTRRNRTIHARMRAYLYELKHRDDLQTAIIPIGDGVTVSVKRGERNTGEGRQG
jgi:predicted O-methyltransferase YrrM